MSTDVLLRQRALIPQLDGGLEGWMDEDAAAAAGQLFGSGPSGLLVIDSRELLTSTARVVGAELGELHFKVWMALITLHVAHGMPEHGKGSSTITEFGSIVWGTKELGGNNTRNLLRALMDLRDARFTLPGFDFDTQRPAASVSDTNLLINLKVDDTILQTYTRARPQSAEERLRRSREIGRKLGGRSAGTLGWRLHPDYTQRLAGSDLRRFDWSKAQKLRGSALALWMVFTSPRVPYRSMLASSDPDHEFVDVPLTIEHCQALGVHNAADAGRRRTLNEAGRRVQEADRSFLSIEAHGGRGQQSFLRIVRRRPSTSPVARPYGLADQLTLTTA